MILIDTSIWIDHFHKTEPGVAQLLLSESVIIHPMIIGEIALGSIKNRKTMLAFLQELPRIIPASHAEVMAMIEWHAFTASGIGYVDTHLLTAVYVSETDLGLSLWTRDKKLHAQASRLGVAYAP